MDLICVMCGEEPQEGDYFVQLSKWVTDYHGSGPLGHPVMICVTHLPLDLEDAFANGGYAYRDHITKEGR